MKKIILTLLCLTVAFSAMAQNTTPEMLKKRDMFTKTDAYDPPSIFADRNANIELIKEYEAAPATYKPEELMPIAVCYLSLGDVVKAKAAFESFLSARPTNIRAMRTLGTINLLMKNASVAIDYYKKAIAAGDELSNIFLGSTYIMNNKIEDVKDLLPALKKMSRDNLEALNVCMMYAFRDKASIDKTLAKELLDAINTRTVMDSATPDGLSTILRLYAAERDVWPSKAIVIPARAAALAQAWVMALDMYKKVLADNPDDTLALRGMGLVSYRTGDVMGAADYVMKAYKCGDKEAATDGVELFLLSRMRSVWDIFKPLLADARLFPQVRAGLVQYAVGQEDAADIFYAGAIGTDANPLYQDAGVRKLLEEGVAKYKNDARAAKVNEVLLATKK